MFGHLIFYQSFANPSNGKKNCALKRALTLFHTQYLKDFGKEDNSEQIDPVTEFTKCVIITYFKNMKLSGHFYRS